MLWETNTEIEHEEITESLVSEQIEKLGEFAIESATEAAEENGTSVKEELGRAAASAVNRHRWFDPDLGLDRETVEYTRIIELAPAESPVDEYTVGSATEQAHSEAMDVMYLSVRAYAEEQLAESTAE